MDPAFWLQRWAEKNIAFHRSEANPALANHFGELSLPIGSRVFVPLCGKTRDIAWLLSKGYGVAGIELVEMAVVELFDDLGAEPEKTTTEAGTLYSATDVDVFVGDVFDLSRETLGSVDAIYDRAALVALPRAMRTRYAAHLLEITSAAPQLLITYEYDQSLMEGPPFSVWPEEICDHYGDSYSVSLLSRTKVAGGLKGKCAANECVWLLQNRTPS